MSYFDKTKIEELPSRYRANLINSISGYKSCNLIGTRSSNGIANLAIFNSIIHIGSSPAMLGFVLRPLTVRRDTFDNIRETGKFTVNQVTSVMVEQSHQTSAKYGQEVSEFEAVGLTEQYIEPFEVPYVAESALKMGCRYKNHYHIEENGCLLVIGSIEHIYFPEGVQDPDGFVHLEKLNTVAGMGIDGYALPKYLGRLSYARPESNPVLLKHGS
ncbi:flavin reductase family protein [Muriicola sp.]|uniref:flavin reductase family protein n=1 Tax=Muriicola sp. TaxID=2020856 RepID=UPI0035685D8F